MKVSIIGGAGVVGASAAYRIALDNTASEILLVDRNRNLAQAHALDIEQAVVHRSSTVVNAGEIKDTADSSLIILTASVPHRTTVSSRSEFLNENLPLMTRLTEDLLRHSPDALWLVATVPVDPIVFLLHRIFSIPSRKIFGLNRNDTCRLKWAISRRLSVPADKVEAFVIGEHGESQVPVFSQVRVNGRQVLLNADQTKEVLGEVSNFFTDWNRLQPGRTAGWTSAESIGDIFRSIRFADDHIWPCSTPLQGEYNLSGVSLGVPLRFDSEGIREIIELDLEKHERQALERSGEIVRQQIEQGMRIVKNQE